jgi:cytochrome P450
MKLADFATPEFFQNPYPIYEKLRAEGPLVPIGPNTMMSGQYDVVEKLLSDRRMARNFEQSIRARYGDEGFRQPVLQAFRKLLFVLNPPEHTRLRNLVMKAFGASQIDSMRGLAYTTAHRLIDEFEEQDTVDLVSAYAQPFPVEIINAMMGVRREHSAQLADALKHVANLFDPVAVDAEELARANDAYRFLDHYFGELIEDRRKRPGTDLISLLISVEDNDRMLAKDEIVANVIMFYLDGHETTTHMIGNALVALQRHPEQFDALKRDLARLPNAVSELLRYDGSVHLTARTAAEDMEVNGVTVPRNTHVYLSLAAANRDPKKFDKPDRLDIERVLPRVMTFGGGIHHCLGYRLALLELETALGVLLSRLPGLTLAGLDDLHWLPRGTLRGVEKLTAHW